MKDGRSGEVMELIAVTATAEAQYDPPADVVARAKAIFGRRRPEGIRGLTRILARLIYDSFRDPLPAGMRAGDRPCQALYEAGDFAVDLHVKQERVGRERHVAQMVLVGQIADRKEPTRRMADLPVFLMSGTQIAARALSNHMGEFHLECNPRKRLRLEIPVDGEKSIEVPLHRFTAATLRKALAVGVGLISVLWGAPSVLAGERFVLRADKGDVAAICQNNGLRRIARVGRDHLTLVEGPDGASREEVEARVATDPRVLDFEPEVRIRRKADDRPSAGIPRDGSVDTGATDFFGGSAWVGYSHQPAGDLIGLPQLRADGETGRGAIVAIVDTGVDPNHEHLKRSLVPGYDFTRDLAGAASEWTDLDQETVTILEQKRKLNQETVTILERTRKLNQETVTILERNSKLAREDVTLVELKQSDASLVGEETIPLPPDFGHGTMMAGLIHVVAPEAKIMPLKAFRADGSSRTSDIVRAIYHAVDNGANVINLSFSFSPQSREIRRAIQFATSRGVICVASVGNDGQETIVYPAALKRVLGVASTTLLDERASFSNYGEELAKLAAPGENLVTTFPGDRYAIVSGTSFSAGLVSGASAVLAGVSPNLDFKDATEAFEHSRYISEDLGWGRIDIPSAVAALPPARRRDREEEER